MFNFTNCFFKFKGRISKFQTIFCGLSQGIYNAYKKFSWKRIITIKKRIIFAENRKCTEWPKVILNSTRPKVPNTCYISTLRVTINDQSLSLTVARLPIIPIIDFAIHYNVKFNLSLILAKMQKNKGPNQLLWGPPPRAWNKFGSKNITILEE